MCVHLYASLLESLSFSFSQDNGSVVNEGYPGQQARFDDFMSDDGQFVWHAMIESVILIYLRDFQLAL